MQNHEITSVVGRHKARKRIGRGRASGQGKTAGKGHKGQRSRAGATRLSFSEGGQMPLFRRLPKRGFNNYQFETRYEVINISQLECFADGMDVGLEQLVAAGLINKSRSKVKVLGDGELTKKLNVTAHKFSKSAQEKIAGCGGAVNIVE
jgi:large subunit ribosomal protein L15